jgi:hypothetical protein
LQNDFPSHDIECLDFAQMPRMPSMDDVYLRNFMLKGTNVYTANLQPSARLWELTDTRYLLMDKKSVELLNEHADPVQRGFHLLAALRYHLKDGVQYPEDAGDLTVDSEPESDPKAASALIEFDHALPRAKLFANWRTPPDGEAMLATLLSTNFNPSQTVLLWTNSVVDQKTGDTNTDAGSVAITDYQPKYVTLQADAKTPAVLLLNDRYSANWRVFVDKAPATLLRCNYIMRGVYLSPGQHSVEFRYRPDLKYLYVSLGGWASGLLVVGFLICARKKPDAKTAPAKPAKLDKAIRS